MAYRFNTLCVKEAQDPRTTKPHQLPIYSTSSFEFSSVEEGQEIFSDPSKGHLYARFNNPTVDAVAQKIASLEAYNCKLESPWGIMTSSGMSAIMTVITAELQAGDKILTQGNLYGGTTELLSKVVTKYGIDIVYTNLTEASSVEEAIDGDGKIKMIYFETPSNPALDCIDLEAIATIAKSKGITTVVDNTFCTPFIQQPFKYGVDYIIHSTTKYLNGHGNSISGIMIGHTSETRQKAWTAMKLLGTNCSPWEAWLTNNGLKTLPLRMRQHSSNGLALSDFLNDHSKVDSVNYLGLRNHKYHELATKQMNGYGGMMCFEVQGGIEGGLRFMNAINIGSLAPTMGDIDTLIMHPASMSNRNIPRDIRIANGISDSLIRVSVGVEDIDDLREDFDKALAQV